MTASSLFDADLFRRGKEFLRTRDPVLARVMDECGEVRLAPNGYRSHFEALAEAIVYQQLSGMAAERIFSRLRSLFPSGEITPRELAGFPDDVLRGTGLSQMKVSYLKDLTVHALQPDNHLERLHELADNEVEEALVRLRGIGPWSVHMFLIFRLGRPDVLPDADLGIRKAIRRAYALGDLPKPAHVRRLADPWRPYATIASLYLWRSLEKRG